MDLLLEIKPELYGPFMTTDEKGENILILQLLNAIYGEMLVNLLYYKKIVKKLKSTGFQLNPYDPYVANCLISYTQQNICFNVDNCNISHQDIKVNH